MKRHQNKDVTSVKVFWMNQHVENATWEVESKII